MRPLCFVDVRTHSIYSYEECILDCIMKFIQHMSENAATPLINLGPQMGRRGSVWAETQGKQSLGAE